ncbi:hypothetical protein ACF061_12630 [Streptomyces sp. NPDC015220]|uniref:hypothetical protein n=1 Tax=Streptomyces sp. NPDC015220 TaxID=3364947 RepID=UPI0036FCDDE7
MSEQHTATTLTVAAVIAMILIARAAVLHRGGRGRDTCPARPPRRRGTPSAVGTPPPSAGSSKDAASRVVREAEQHVRRCWQRLQAPSDPRE